MTCSRPGGSVRSAEDMEPSTTSDPTEEKQQPLERTGTPRKYAIFLRTEGKNLHVTYVTEADTVATVQDTVTGVWGIPVDMQHIVYPGNLRSLQPKDVLSQHGITKDATLYVVLRARGGMDTGNESVTTPTKKVPAPQHTVPSPHRHGPYTAMEEKGVEQTTLEKLRRQIMMGHTSAHCWETWQHDIGFQLNRMYYRDKLAMQPRKALLE